MPPKKSAKKAAASGSAQPAFDAELLQSTFLREVRKQFFDSRGKPTWPKALPGIRKQDVAAAEMPLALWALFRRVAMEEDMPSVPAGTALGRIKSAAKAAKWPGPGSKVPTAWKNRKANYRLFEVAWSVNILLEAYARTGGGGGPRDWPGGAGGGQGGG